MSLIPYGKHNISEDDIKAVVDVLRSDFLTQGPVVPQFERAVANYCGARYGVAVNSATSALHIACAALGVGRGDMVWTTPITFVASANCARYCGADVDFVDIDPKTYNMSVDRLSEKLENAKRSARLPKVVIPVHLSGQSCEMEAIHDLSKIYGFRIIEDASHAIGGDYQNKKVGSCIFSDITVFSFHPVKIITTGEGGMAVTNDLELVKHMARLRSHGITRDPTEMAKPPDGSWYYQQIDLGFNYRMTDIQAALGICQLRRVDEFVRQRHAIALQYEQLLSDSAVTRPWQHNDSYSSLHLYIIRLPGGEKKFNHREIFERMRSEGVGVNLHYIPVYRQPYYESLGFSPRDFPEAERYYSEAITLPIYPGLSPQQQQDVVRRLTTHTGYQTVF